MKILVTAGPTYEPLDPVRFIGNRSSGKMGIAIAEEFAQRGDEVTLVKGPTSLDPNSDKIQQVKVQTAAEMFDACAQYFSESDVIVFAAAVADYTPANPAKEKIKKQGETLSLELVRTKDIAGELGKLRTDKQIIAGFALETENEMENAADKLKRKHFDLIVLNSLRDEGAGFQGDTNKITIIDKEGNVTTFGLKSKAEVAKDIVDYVSKMMDRK